MASTRGPAKRPAHTGSITLIGKHKRRDKWRVRVSAGTDQDGKRIQRSKIVVGSRHDAERAASELQVLHGSNGPQPVGTMTLGELMTKWRSAHESTWTPSNFESTKYLMRYDKLTELYPREVDRISSQDLRTLYDRLLRSGRADGTVRRVHSALRSAMSWGVSEGLIATNPAAGVRRVSGKAKQRPVPTIEGVKAMVSAADPWTASLISFALATGARRGELAALRWDDVERAGDFYRVNFQRRISAGEVVDGLKASDSKAIMVDAALVERLREASLSGEWVFGEGDACPRPDSLAYRYKKALANVIEQHPEMERTSLHGLRHLCASVLIDSGLDIVKVATHLGHRNAIVTLSVYAHLLRKDGTDAGAAMAGII